MGHLLNELFIELDASSPAEPSGGCTASIVLQIGTTIYIANAGDSRSFVAVHITDPISKTETTQIIYGTREDKPHLSFERLRVEAMVRTQLNSCRDHGYIFYFSHLSNALVLLGWDCLHSTFRKRDNACVIPGSNDRKHEWVGNE